MISPSDLSLLAQRADWLEGAIILGIVVLSAIASAGKWIVRQIAEKRERTARQREGIPLEMPQTPVASQRDYAEGPDIPPLAAPVPPTMTRPARKEIAPPPPVMERVLEVLLERTAGTPLERRIREAVEKTGTPPPPPTRKAQPKRASTQQPARPQQPRTPARPLTIAEREAQRDRAKQTAVELEEQQMIRREQKFTEDTDQRLGRVETHIGGTEVRDSGAADPYGLAPLLENPESLRRAILLSEILAPPLALREGNSF